MNSPSSRPSPLGYWIDLAVQLQRDADCSVADLYRRDRAIARGLGTGGRDSRALLLRWLDALRARGPALPGHALGLAYRLTLVALVILGLLLGWGAVGAVFAYDGSRPVNVVHVLAVFVFAQWVLLLFLGIVLLPERVMRRLPGGHVLQEILGWLSPGQLARLAAHRLPSAVRERLRADLRQHAGFWPAFRRVQRWAIVFGAQWFAVAFNLAALSAMLYRVTFSDLAFAWSTTLEPNVAVVHRWTSTLALPWAWAAPAAVPSPELIGQTLYYRQSGPPAGLAPARWGGWWPFLATCLMVYGLLPRGVLLTVAGVRFQRVLRRALIETPGATVVIDRLTSAWVSTQAVEAEAETERGGLAPEIRPGSMPTAEAGVLALVNWGGLELADARLRERAERGWGREVIGVHHAGGRRTVEEDAHTVAALAALPDGGAVAVFVKAWEPPLLDLTDFLRELRQALGPRRLLMVTPVALDAAGALTLPGPTETGQWQQRMRRLGDAALVVRPWPAEGGPA